MVGKWRTVMYSPNGFPEIHFYLWVALNCGLYGSPSSKEVFDYVKQSLVCFLLNLPISKGFSLYFFVVKYVMFVGLGR